MKNICFLTLVLFQICCFSQTTKAQQGYIVKTLKGDVIFASSVKKGKDSVEYTTLKGYPGFIATNLITSIDPVESFELFQGVNYTVIEKTNLGSIKGSIDIRLEGKVTEDFLHKLALHLQKSESIEFDRLFITYYLLNMELGSGAWATTHFDPDLKVKILGTTIEEEGLLMDASRPDSEEKIGEWFDDSPYVSGKYTLMKKGGKVFMVIKFKDGSVKEDEMIQKMYSERLRFDEKEGNDFGEYYLIERNESLGSYDSEGLIRTMRPIN